MGAVEQDLLSLSERGVQKERGVNDARAKPFGVCLVLLHKAFELDRLLAVDALEPEVLLSERDLDLLAQDLRVEDVLHADPQPHRLVGVAGPDASLRRPDRELAETPLARLVDGEVPRHDQVCVAGEPDEVGRDSARAEVVELLDQDLRVDDAPGTDHALLALEDPRRDMLQLVGFAVDHERVAGVRAAVVAADEVGVPGEQVDDLAFPLVAPLRAHDDGGGHGRQYAATRLRARGSRCGRPREPLSRGGGAGWRSGRRRGPRARATHGSLSRSRSAAAARAG